jgi:hypothetical protein
MNIEIIENKIENKKNVISTIKDTVQKYLLELSQEFEVLNVKPKVTFNENNTYFKLDYSNLIGYSGNSNLEFKLCLEAGDVKIISNVTFQNNKTYINATESIEEIINFSNNIHFIKELLTTFDKDSLLIKLNFLKCYKKNIKNSQLIIEDLNNNLIEEKNKSKFILIEKIFPTIGTFCIDSFLCKRFNIKFSENPSRDNIKQLKNIIIDSNDGERINSFNEKITFIIKNQKGTSIEFDSVNLHFNSDGTFDLYHGKSIKTKKGINELLSNQFYYKKELITQDDSFSFNNKKMSKLINNSIDINEIHKIFHEDIMTFNIKEF